MYQAPSRRKSRRGISTPNLTPILDAVFIFIFFLLMSANFIKLFEISSDVPILSDQPPPRNQKPPLALTLKITDGGLQFYSGVPARHLKTFRQDAEGSYVFEEIREFLVEIKKKHPKENSIVFEPEIDLEYLKLVEIMDAVRMLNDLDEAIYYTDKDGVDVRAKNLFGNIIFGNIQS